MNNTDILDACLKAIDRGEATINDCVARYPQVDDLREMLMAAQDARAMGRPLMSMAARTVLEQRLITRMESSRPGSRYMARLWTRIPVTLAATLLLVLIVAAGVLRLSSAAVPGDVLYGVKRASEQASLAFSSPAERPAVLAHIAEARLDELTALANRKWPTNTALTDALNSLNTAVAAQPDPAVRAALYARGIQTMAQLAASGQPASSLMAALLGIATPTRTPIIIATATETLTETPTMIIATKIKATTFAPPPTRLATHVPISPTQIAAPVQPTPIPPAAPSGDGGGNNHPTPDNHGSGENSSDSSHNSNSGSSQDGSSGGSHDGGDH